MGDIDMTKRPFTLDGVQSGNDNPQTGCANCHDLLGKVGSSNLFAPIVPAVKDGTLDSNDPYVPKPASPAPLSVICGGITYSYHYGQLKTNQYGKLATDLCEALLTKANEH